MTRRHLLNDVRDTIEAHPYLAAAAGVLLTVAAGSLLSLRRRIAVGRLDLATDEETEEEIAVGAIAY